MLVYLHETGPGFRRGAAARLLSHGREFMHYQGRPGSGSCSTSTASARRSSRDLGLHTIRLLTNHPRKIVALEGFGIEVVDQIPIRPGAANIAEGTTS